MATVLNTFRSKTSKLQKGCCRNNVDTVAFLCPADQRPGIGDYGCQTRLFKNH